LQDEEQVALRISSWTLHLDVVSEQASERIGKRKDSIALALAANMKAALRPDHVIEMQLDDFSRTQSAQEHQVDDREISIATKAPQERTDLVRPEGLDQEARLLDADLARPPFQTVQPQLAISAWSLIVRCWTNSARPLIEHPSGAELKQQAHGRQSTVDGSWRSPITLLRRNEVHQIGCNELLQLPFGGS
jgi:hypothetical protein